MSQDGMNLGPSAWSEDMSRQLAYVLASMTQRLDESANSSSFHPTPQPSLRKWLSHYLNDRSLPSPPAAFDLPEPPAPNSPFRDRLIESWDLYYPWLRIWQQKVRDAAADAHGRGLLGNETELMHRLKRRHPPLSDISKCTTTYRTGFGAERFTFTGIGSNPAEHAGNEDAMDREVVVDDSSSTLSDTTSDPNLGSKDVIDLRDSDSPESSHVNPRMFGAIRAVDYMAQYGEVGAQVYHWFNTALGRVSRPEPSELQVPSDEDERQLLSHAEIADVEFDTTTACTYPITLSEAIHRRFWVCRTRVGVFCLPCPCPEIVSPNPPGSKSGATHDLVPRNFYFDPLVGDQGLRHFKTKHSFHGKTTPGLLATRGRKVQASHSEVPSIAAHNFAISLWHSELDSQWDMITYLVPTNEEIQRRSTIGSLVSKSGKETSLTIKNSFRFRIKDGGDDTYVVLCCGPFREKPWMPDE
ncbi:hypothetical protein PG997_001893 [Apiospora hydei]|uniref:Uncharacterized protein n=1 Tax=Apiospora hydei TaxID=1337664 RepID=A0ABR1X7U6_9PEZI